MALLIAGIFAALALPVAAADSVDEGYGAVKPIPGTRHEMNRDFEKEAETYYDFIGTVDNVQDEGIVVGDSYMKFAPAAKLSGAGAGVRVGIILNSNGEVVLCEPYRKISR